MPRKKKNIEPPPSGRPPFHESLRGFDIRVNSFGEMESTFDIERLNDFLNKEVHDKKLDNPVNDEEDKNEEE